MTRRIAIVDAYSAANQYAPEAKRRGYACVHVQSNPDIPNAFEPAFRREDFIENIIHQGCLEETIKKLKELDIRCLFVGTETGVELADSLSEGMGLITNGTKMSRARRDKYHMHEALRAKGLRFIRHIRSNDVNKILSWVKENGFAEVVAKPPKSAGTDNVLFCRTADGIRSAFDRIVGKVNEMGSLNDDVLVQERINGAEHVVNSVSCNGRRYFTGTWRYTKKKSAASTNIYDRDDLLPGTGKIETELFEYVNNVLDALEIEYGPAHAEVMYDKDGPVLVEVAARIDGMENSGFFKAATGRTQVDMTLDAYLSPDKLKAEASMYTPKNEATVVSLISNQNGIVASTKGFDEIRKLESFFDLKTGIVVGSRVKTTIDIFTLPGIVYLVHKDRGVIERDYRAIREMEKNGLFGLCI